VREELERVRVDAAGRAADLERRLAELDASLAEERRAHAGAASDLEAARAQLALAEAANRAESVARAALDEEIDRERLNRAALAAELANAQAMNDELSRWNEQARAELAEAQAMNDELSGWNEQARAELAEATAKNEDLFGSVEEAGAELAAARAASGRTEGALAAARQELEAARLRIAQLERELDSATSSQGGLLARIAELERSADADLERRAREQAAAAARVAPPPDAADFAAGLDAAAASLRAAAPVAAEPAAEAEPAESSAPPSAVESSAPPAAVESSAPPEVAESSAPPAAVESSTPPAAAESSAPPAAAESSAPPAAVESSPPPAPAGPPRLRIVTESTHPARGDVVGTSQREYPWLRGALVKLAHDDPHAATRLLLGLVPAHRVIVGQPLEYDLTIVGDGTYAISVGPDGARATSIAEPRPRKQAAFHVAADVVTLAELLAGVDKRMGRWFGSVKVRGRKRGARTLKELLVVARLSLADAARAGAELEPDVVFRAFAYAIRPAWTKGHEFAVAQEIVDPTPQRWHIVVRNGAPVAVERRAAAPPDAVVSMTRSTYGHLLRGEQPPRGERPTVHGDRAAVAQLRAWTERAQGRGA
jgi:hypothetical protein